MCIRDRFQAIQHKLADMSVEVDASRLLTYRAAWMHKEGIPCFREACVAKLFASETWMRTAWKGMQILGGYGYTMEFDMQRYFRDAPMSVIGGGSAEIQRNIIGRLLVS